VALLELKNLKTFFATKRGTVKANMAKKTSASAFLACWVATASRKSLTSTSTTKKKPSLPRALLPYTTPTRPSKKPSLDSSAS